MKLRKFLSGVLAAVMLCGMLTVTPASAAGSAGFVDIADSTVQEAAALLQIMGVVDGNGYGYFFPELHLTRAQFCKMAVQIRGEGSKAEAQQSRTIFLDVPATHWGRGYINYASSIAVTEGGERLVMGVGDGSFHPDEDIAFDQAVTMTMRLLGYTAADVSTGAAWYDGYLSMADSIGLLDGLEGVAHDAPLTRAQAAILFENLLFTEPKGSKETYLVSLGGSEVEGGVLLDVDATADNGDSAVKTTKGVYKTDRAFSAALEGKEGKAVLDKDEKLIAFVPKAGMTEKVVNVTSTQATYLIASGGEKLTVEPETVVYQDNKETTWKDAYLNLTCPASVTFHYGADGKLKHLFFSASDPDNSGVMVARRAPSTSTNPFSALASGSNYTMFKNGVAATAADIRQYDVATWDAGTRVIQVSDLKLTGVYEDAAPSPDAPVSIDVMGHTFKVLSTAREDLTHFKVGDKVTLLLTANLEVAGVVSPDTVRGEAVGVASVSDTTATVTLLQGGLEVSGTVSKGTEARCNGQLVTVASNAIGKLSLTAISGSEVKSDLNVSARKLGDRDVAENATVYDRVKGGQAVKVDYASLTMDSIPKEKISFVSYDYAGRVKYLVLDDVTGDAYTYGYLSYTADVWSSGERTKYATLCVKQADSSGKETTSSQGNYVGDAPKRNAPGGVSYDAKGFTVAYTTLKSLTGVDRDAFDPEAMTVTIGRNVWHVAENVQCYNEVTKTWFKPGKEGMEAARAYSGGLTLYYDRPAAEGGKIRLIVIPD